MTTHVAIVYHSRSGTMRRLARHAAAGARASGATVRLLRVADPIGGVRADAPADPPATPEDLLWADGLVLATPTYFGNVSAAFKRFLDSADRVWTEGRLTDRVVTGMTSATSLHGGQEATLLALYQTAYHWGSWVVGADPACSAFPGTGGNPYGLSVSYRRGRATEPVETRAAWALGRRLADITARSRPRTEPVPPGLGRTKVAVIHHAGDEATRLLAQECAAGARECGAEVRLRRVADPAVRTWRSGAPPAIPVTPADIAWADAVVFGAQARLGTMAAPLVSFVQSLLPPSGAGPLAGKPVSGFTSAPYPHAGSESALLTLHQMLLHCGAVAVPPGYTDPAVGAAGGNPYGTSYALSAGPDPTTQAMAAVRHQGRRMALVGDRLRGQAVATLPDSSASTHTVPGREAS
ncbi:flavodoxin family protein [Streptomyces sp. NPDC020096]